MMEFFSPKLNFPLKSFLFFGCLICLTICSGCQLFQNSSLPKQFAGGEPDDFEAMERRLAEEDTVQSDLAFAPGLNTPTNRSRLKGLILSAKVDTPKVKGGRPIRVSCLLRNDSMKSMPLSYTSSQRFDVSVFEDKRQTKPVHVWSRGKSFAMIYAERMLHPNQNISEIIEVPTTRVPMTKELVPNSLTRPLLPGTYYLWVTHAGTPYMATGPFEVKVIE